MIKRRRERERLQRESERERQRDGGVWENGLGDRRGATETIAKSKRKRM